MRDNVAVPKTNAGRESQNKLFLWFTWLDLLIVALFALLPCCLVIFVAHVTNWWMILVVAGFFGWAALLTYPFGGCKIYYQIWDVIFKWIGSTKKHYTKEEAKHSFEAFSDGSEDNIKWFERKVKNFGQRKSSSNKAKFCSCFYEIVPTDMSLANEDELKLCLDRFNSLFSMTDDVDFSLVKIDWPYNFDNNINWLTQNYNTWKNEYKCKDDDLKLLNIYDKTKLVSSLQDKNNITQKRYFLIISAEDEEKTKRAFDIIHSDLYDAGLRVYAASKSGTQACISKLVPSSECKATFDFSPRYYVADKSDKQNRKYYRTIVINSVPKVVEPFWNQNIFNMDNVTVQMTFRSIEKSSNSWWNKDPKQRYITRLNTLALDKKARNIVEEAAKEHELGSIADLANDVANGDEKIKVIKYLITFWSNSRAGLKAREKQIKTFINKSKMKMNYCTFKQWDAYKANVPTFANELEKEFNMMLSSTALALSYPFVYSDYLDQKGDFYGFKINGSNPIMIDFTKSDEIINMWNIFLFGKSGGGKTTAVKKILRNFIVNPRFRKLFLIDPENEYTNAVKNFGGDVIDCSGLSDMGRINPFEIFSTSDEEGRVDNHYTWQQHFFYLEEFFKGLYANELNQESMSILTDIVVLAYNKKKIYPSTNFKKLKPKDWPIFSDVVNEAEKLLAAARKHPTKGKYNISTLETIYYPLKQFASDGVFAKLWNGATNIKLDNRIICFNIQKLNTSGVPQRIKSTQMRLLLRFIEDLCIENKDYNERLGLLYDDEHCYHTAVFCDEFHLLINKSFPEPLEWFYGFIKRIRKYKGRGILITQNINDMVSDEAIIRLTTGIINSCQFMFIFKLLANDITNLNTLLREIGGLKSEEINFLKTGEQGQAIFVSGNDIHIKMKFDWENGSLEQNCLNTDFRNYRQIIENGQKEAKKVKPNQLHQKASIASGKA